MRAADGLLDRARHPARGLREARGLVHGLVPGLLLGGDVARGGAGISVPGVGGAGRGVHDLAGAGGIAALRGVVSAVGMLPAIHRVGLAVRAVIVAALGRTVVFARSVAVGVGTVWVGVSVPVVALAVD